MEGAIAAPAAPSAPASAAEPDLNAAESLLARLLPRGSTKLTVSEGDLRAALAA